MDEPVSRLDGCQWAVGMCQSFSPRKNLCAFRHRMIPNVLRYVVIIQRISGLQCWWKLILAATILTDQSHTIPLLQLISALESCLISRNLRMPTFYGEDLNRSKIITTYHCRHVALHKEILWIARAIWILSYNKFCYIRVTQQLCQRGLRVV